MSQIDYEQDRVESITQADAAKTLSDKVYYVQQKIITHNTQWI